MAHRTILPRTHTGDPWQIQTRSPDRLRHILKQASSGRSGLHFVITMAIEQEVHLAASSYPMAHTDEETWKQIVAMFDEGTPSAEAVFTTTQLRKILEEANGTFVSIDFLRQSWVFWDRVAPRNWGLKITSEASLEFELSEDYFRHLIRFRNLDHTGQYRVFNVVGEQYAALIQDPGKPTVYALQNIRGEAGLMLFNAIVTRIGLKKLNTPLQQLTNWPLIRFRAQSFLP